MTQLGEPIAIGQICLSPVPDQAQTQAFDEQFQFVDQNGEAFGPARYEIIKSDGARIRGVTDSEGRTPRISDPNPTVVRVRFLGLVRAG